MEAEPASTRVFYQRPGKGVPHAYQRIQSSNCNLQIVQIKGIVRANAKKTNCKIESYEQKPVE